MVYFGSHFLTHILPIRESGARCPVKSARTAGRGEPTGRPQGGTSLSSSSSSRASYPPLRRKRQSLLISPLRLSPSQPLRLVAAGAPFCASQRVHSLLRGWDGSDGGWGTPGHAGVTAIVFRLSFVETPALRIQRQLVELPLVEHIHRWTYWLDGIEVVARPLGAGVPSSPMSCLADRLSRYLFTVPAVM